MMRENKHSADMFKTVYCTIEDDVKTITARLKAEPVAEFVLVFPKRSYLFSDPLNLKLLKKQLDILKKQARIMTMDERGQQAAAAAGFMLEPVPVRRPRGSAGDMAVRSKTEDLAAGEAEAVIPPASVIEPVAAVEPAARPQATPRAKPIPRVTVHDTIFSETPRRASVDTERIRQEATTHKRRRVVAVGLFICVLLFGSAGAMFALPRAEVVLVPKSEPVQRDMDIALSVDTKAADATSLALPAQYTDVVRPAEEKFDATGKKEVGTAARGTVRIFNLAGGPINLRAATTTLAANGRQFAFTKDQLYLKSVSRAGISNPAAGVVAEVVATTPGEASNIVAGTKLVITNQVFGSKPEVLYAVAEDAFTGGSSRFVTTVEEQDVANAKNALVASVVDAIGLDMKAKGQLLAESAYTAEVANFTTDKPAGTESPTFTAQGTVRIRGLAFQPLDLTEMVRRRVEQVLPQTGRLQAASKDSMSFQVKHLDVVGGTMTLAVHLETRMLQVLDTSSLAGEITGKKQDQAEALVMQKQPVQTVRFHLWPAWYAHIPYIESRIAFSQAEE